MASGTICAPVKYLRRFPLYDHEKPFQYLIPIPPDSKDQRTTNVEFETRGQTFTDIRHRLGNFDLDSNGFEVKSVPTSLQAAEATDQDVIRGRYLPEVEKILKDNVAGGFDRVVFFDWRVRDAAVPEEATKMKMSDLAGCLRPVGHVHIDHAPRAIVGRVQSLADDDSNFLLRGRARVINVWRPLEHPVEDFPLAFCDASTLAEQDIVECDHVRRNYRGATLYPYFDPVQKFYYVGGQTPDEVVLFKIFDSDPDVRAKRCAHCSFGHPSQTPTSRPRKSIEVRALLFNYP